MAFCKVARHIFQRRSRGFCQKAEVQEQLWSNVLACFEEHLTAAEKVFLPELKLMIASLIAQKNDLREQLRELKNELQQQRNDFQVQENDLQERMEKRIQLRAQIEKGLREQISLLKQDTTRAKLETLRVEGLNNTMGLFEKVQEQLASGTLWRKDLKGTGLWEAILRNHALLRACIEKHTNVHASDVPKQALLIYHIYSVLSQHVHVGKGLAQLQVDAAGNIVYQRGPMSPEQVSIFECMGRAAGFDIVEDPVPGLADLAM